MITATAIIPGDRPPPEPLSEVTVDDAVVVVVVEDVAVVVVVVVLKLTGGC